MRPPPLPHIIQLDLKQSGGFLEARFQLAKVRVGNPTPNVLPKAKAAFFTRLDPRHGPIAQSVGPPGGRVTNSPWKFYQRQEFRIAAAWSSSVDDITIEASQLMVAGTNMVPRDVIIKAMYGNLWNIVGPDGTTWTRMRDVSPNPQLILDLITTDAGSIIYRSPNGWVGLEPNANGYVLKMFDGNPLWMPEAAGGAGAIDFQLFEASGTWTKPAWAQWCQAILIGGGGGGGSGARRASGTNSSGGGGGGGGGISSETAAALYLNPTETVTVGPGGVARPGITVDSTNGLQGGAGTASSITWGKAILKANGATGGGAGSTANASGGPGGAGNLWTGQTGEECTGGGGGAGASSTPANHNGGGGGNSASGAILSWTTPSGGIGSTKTAPQDGFTLGIYGLTGVGPGGGWAASDGTAGDGKDGFKYGAGGSGGGASINGHTSGASGKGSDGAVLVISW